MSRLKRSALEVCRTQAGARLISEVMRWAPWLTPRRLETTREFVLFPHPVPMMPGHLLAVTRRDVGDALTTGVAADHFWAAIEDAYLRHASVTECAITNLGHRQDVKLLHVHLLPRSQRWMASDPLLRAPSVPEAMAEVRAVRPDLPGRAATIGFAPAREGGWNVWVDSVWIDSVWVNSV